MKDYSIYVRNDVNYYVMIDNKVYYQRPFMSRIIKIGTYIEPEDWIKNFEKKQFRKITILDVPHMIRKFILWKIRK